jgi:hydroxyacylglutathione hydrolase
VVFRQFVDDDLGCASYLIGDEETGDAVVVDPAYATEQYVDEAERRGVRVVRVLETHNHADHVSGHGRLALDQGATVSIHRLAEPAYEHAPLEDGEEISLGRVCIRVVHTPGHRPEHVAFAVADRSRAEEPWLVLTGDSLFVGDAGRPDLAVDAREGAADLFHSLRRLVELPDGVEVYPGHVAGSLCGAAMSSKPSTTIGFERRYNGLLRLDDVSEFVEELMSVPAPKPPNLDRIVELNRGPFLGAPAPLGEARTLDDATILDVRPAEEHAAGHVRGALNVPVGDSSFATKAGFVLTPEERIVVHASSREEAERAARGLRSVGFLELGGYAVDAPLTERARPVEVDELERLLRDGAVNVVDVREPHERDRGYIPGSRNVPYRLLRAYGADAFGDGGKPVVTICESGARAAIAASILTAAGVEARPVLRGGIASWEARGHRTIAFRRCGS